MYSSGEWVGGKGSEGYESTKEIWSGRWEEAKMEPPKEGKGLRKETGLNDKLG